MSLIAAHAGPMLGGVALALAFSPLLAGWADALVARQRRGWWRPRRVPVRRWAPVAASAVALAFLAGLSRPWPAWWLFAAGGAVLGAVDSRAQLLPARLVYPLAGADLLTLGVTALTAHEPANFLRAVLAAVVVGAAWLTCALAMPRGLGLGDVRVAALGAGLLGWHGWQLVIDGQLAVWLIALLVGVVVFLTNPAGRSRHMRVPFGPALVAAPLLMIAR